MNKLNKICLSTEPLRTPGMTVIVALKLLLICTLFSNYTLDLVHS